MQDDYDPAGEVRSRGLSRLSRLTWRASQLGVLATVGFAAVFARTAPADTVSSQPPPKATVKPSVPAASARPSPSPSPRRHRHHHHHQKPAAAAPGAGGPSSAAPAPSPSLAPPSTPPAPPASPTPSPVHTTSSPSPGGGG